MWQINKTFLDNQISAGKTFTLVHNPYEAPLGSGFSMEIEYLKSRDFKNITKSGQYWKITR